MCVEQCMVLTASSRAYHHRPQRRQQLVRPNSSQPIGRNVLLEASITKEQINLPGDFLGWKQKQENPIIFIKKKQKLEYRPSDSGQEGGRYDRKCKNVS
ncbi:hypothetical protein L2E82_22886 [Cichorium intybus]|uniref:Uncharacterized protein n=1 Tax=Cichorium intybus TaxID=13427 RepID=A0ACB9DZF7_CICIN|nr:hypothetical protein L2E82_22886 [Cichorium intybus]